MNLSKTNLLLLAIVLVVIGLAIGRATQSGSGDPAPGTATEQPMAEQKPEIWTCSMHPQVQLPEPGKCPICGMDLILQMEDGGDEELGASTLQISEAARALAEIQTAKVERRSVAHEVSMVGKIAFDETRVAYITSWVSGRIDRMFVDFTGVSVRKGDHLVEIYSPTLYSAQQELLQAIETAGRLEGSGLDILRTTSDQTVISAREKLRLYGLTEAQIQEIVDNGKPNEHVTVLAPIGGVVVHKNALEGMYVKEGTRVYTIADLSKVWVLLDAYETDLAWLRYGQDVEFEVQAYPGEVFHGRVAFIDPLLNDHTRTVKVRLNVDNSDARLKPDMFISATAQAVLTEHGKVVDEALAGMWMCPMHPDVTSDGPGVCPECGMDLLPTSELGFVAQPEEGESLVIPATAALLTGKRAVVYVRLPDQDKPTYEGRVIDLGPRAGDWYVVRGGLREGEDVVVKGNFKIDSELQIRARPSMMSPAEDSASVDHTGMDMQSPPLGSVPPPAFRSQLGAVVDAYLALQEKLVADQVARSEAQRLRDSLSEVNMGLLEGDAHMRWMQQLTPLQKVAESMAATEDLEAQRGLLAPLTDHLVVVLKTFGFSGLKSGASSVGVFHCPMAMDGEGADWLQLGEETKNPYFGSDMLGCGSLQEALGGGN